MILATTSMPLPGLRCIPAGFMLPVVLDEAVDAKAQPGHRFRFSVLGDGGPDFGSTSDTTSFPDGTQIEAEVTGISQATPNSERVVSFRFKYIVIPTDDNSETAIPVTATIQKPDSAIDSSCTDPARLSEMFDEWGRNVAQIAADKYFYGGSAGWAMGRALGALSHPRDASTSYFRNALPADTPAIVRVDRQIYY